MKDPVIGELTYDYGWIAPYSLKFLGEAHPVKLVVPCDEAADIESAQQDAFAKFEESKANLLGEAEDAVFNYYQSICEEYREQLGAELADEKAPLIVSKQELRRIVTPKEIILQESFGSGERVVGLLFDCSWDPALGLAVKFVNEALEEVGSEDIVL